MLWEITETIAVNRLIAVNRAVNRIASAVMIVVATARAAAATIFSEDSEL